MGNIGQSLIGGLQALGGGFQAGPDPLDMILGRNGIAGPVGETEGVMGFPSVSRQGDGIAGLTKQILRGGDASNPQEEAVAVKGWKPKGQTFLGAIADAYLQSKGMAPAFKQQRDERNLMEAMEGFTNEPLEAIRRVAQIPGLQGKAWDLYEKHIDNVRADRTQDSLIGNRQEKIVQQANRLLGSVRVNDDGTSPNYGMVRSMYKDIMARNGIDADLPEEFDLDYIEALIRGDMTANQASMMEFRRDREARQAADSDRRLDQGDRRLNQADTAEAGRNSRAAAAEAGRNARSANKSGAAAGGARKIRTQYGEGEVDPSGKYMRVQGPDGSMYVFKAAGKTADGRGNWVFFKKL